MRMMNNRNLREMVFVGLGEFKRIIHSHLQYYYYYYY